MNPEKFKELVKQRETIKKRRIELLKEKKQVLSELIEAMEKIDSILKKHY